MLPWRFRFAGLVLFVVIVLSSLRAVAATIPTLVAYDAAVRPTATTWIETGPSLRPQWRRAPDYAYDDVPEGYDGITEPRVTGAVHAYDGAIEFADWRELRAEGAIYDAPASTTAAEGIGVAEEIGILRSAARGSGNFGLGAADAATAERLGQAWMGEGATVASDGTTLVSADALRQFRPPSWKPNLGRVQANFEQRFSPSGPWNSNGHLDILYGPEPPP